MRRRIARKGKLLSAKNARRCLKGSDMRPCIPPVLVCVAAACSAGVQAQPVQGKLVRIINPFAAGGNTDIVTRALIDRLAPILKQQFVIENRPGAMTNIASEYV